MFDTVVSTLSYTVLHWRFGCNYFIIYFVISTVFTLDTWTGHRVCPVCEN